MASISRIKKLGVEYDLLSIGMEDAVRRANLAADLATTASVTAQVVVDATQQLIGGKQIPIFDATKTYNKYDFVVYKRDGEDEWFLFEALTTVTPGPWNDGSWRQTSFYDFMRNSINIETVVVRLLYAATNEPISGKTVQYSIANAPVVNLVSDSEGYCTFTVPFGEPYTVIPPAISNYKLLKSKSYLANSANRRVNFGYSNYATDLYVITNDGMQTPMAEFDLANKSNAVLLKFSTSNGDCTFKIHRTPSGNKQWLNTNTILPSLPLITNNNDALADFDGINNTILMETDIADYNSQGNNYISQAVDYVRSETVEIAGEVHKGYFPAIGQMKVVSDNIAKINQAISDLDGTLLTVSSGYWWSSSQNSATYAWLLNYGYLSNIDKTYGYSVLPFFDL